MGETLQDLSHTITPDMPVYPGAKQPGIEEVASHINDGYRETELSYYTHTGTHIDAPAHIIPKGRMLYEYPLHQFLGRGICLDFRKEKSISKKKIEEQIIHFSEIDFILFCTGWDQYWGQDIYYTNFPCLTDSAIDFICTLRLKGVGIDAISFDPIENQVLTRHKQLLRRDILLIENLTNLTHLIGRQFEFSCVPLPIKNIEGSPARVYAKINT